MLYDLTSANFDSVILDPAKSALVAFYTPWCLGCKELLGKMQRVASAFAAEDDVSAARSCQFPSPQSLTSGCSPCVPVPARLQIILAACNAEEEPDIALKNDVSSYPTIIFFASGDDKEAFVYTDADQSVEALVKLVNEESGSQRAVDGGYVGSRGEISALSGLVAKFKSSAPAYDKSVVAEVETAVGGLEDEEERRWGQYYGTCPLLAPSPPSRSLCLRARASALD